jgi:hypothetical protein
MQNFERQTQNLIEMKKGQPERNKVDYLTGLKNALAEVREKIINSEQYKKTDFKSIATLASLMLLISQTGNQAFESNQQIDIEPAVRIKQTESKQSEAITL